MNDDQIKALVGHRLQKSEEALRAAQFRFDQGMLIFAMNRIYYSMYYSVQALFALQGKSFSKHGQIKGFFNREYVKSGKLSKDMGRLFNKAFEYRQKFDYVDFVTPDESMVAEYITKAEVFCDQIRKYVKTGI